MCFYLIGKMNKCALFDMKKSRIVENRPSLSQLPPIILIVSLIGIGNSFDLPIYAHNFNTDETASFVAFADQIKVESELVQTNLANNYISLAQKHANKAASLTPTLMIEIPEENQKIADDLTIAINNLQKVSSSSTSEEQQQTVDRLVSDINATVGEAVNIRLKQPQGEDSSNLLEKGIEFLGIVFGGDNKVDDKITEKETDQALAFADFVDSILINYGNAYAVNFDMTDMSNMAMMGSDPSSMVTSGMADMADNNDNSSSSMSMGSMNMSSSIMNMNNNTNRNYSLIDMADYQSAQALSAKAQEIFDTELKPIASNNNSTNNDDGDMRAFTTNLDNGLKQLNNSIKSKASPMDIMMIVHTQIHPNLLEAFNLELQQQ